MKILFQNEHWIAVDKAAGWLSVPSRMGIEDPRPVVGIELQKTLGQQIFPVHRLDFEVSGTLLFALTAAAQREGNRWFENSEVRKRYEAVTECYPEEAIPQGKPQIWKNKLVRGKKRSFFADYGKDCETQATLVEQKGERARWRLEPRTGRPHQLRLECSSHGYPIVGDALYGAKTTWAEGGIALRSIAIDLTGVSERFGLPDVVKVSGWPEF